MIAATPTTDDQAKYGVLPLSIGDELIVSKYGGTDLEVDGEKLKLIRFNDVIGVIERTAPKVVEWQRTKPSKEWEL